MQNILARGGVEFLAVFLGIALSLWVDEYQKSKDFKSLNNQILLRLYDNLEADTLHFIEWPEIIPKQISKPNIIINFQLLS